MSGAIKKKEVKRILLDFWISLSMQDPKKTKEGAKVIIKNVLLDKLWKDVDFEWLIDLVLEKNY